MSAPQLDEHRDPTDSPTGPAGGELFARRWDDDEPEARPEHPHAPMPARVCWTPVYGAHPGPWGVPGAVARLARGVAPGWRITVTVALGYRMLARKPWHPPEPSLSHVLRARGVIGRDGQVCGAYGMWTDGKFADAAHWRVTGDRGVPADVPVSIGASALRELLTMEPVG